jgi:hypothetical protein
MCVLRRYVKSHEGAREILYISYTAKHRTQGHENVFHIFSGHRKNINLLKTEKLLYLGMLIILDGTWFELKSESPLQ